MAALNMAALLVAIVGPPCARPQSPRPPPTLPLPRPRLARRIAFDALGSRALPLPRCTGPIAPRAIKPRTSNLKGMPPLGTRTPTPSDTHTAGPDTHTAEGRGEGKAPWPRAVVWGRGVVW
jgi:hypothetical protein